MNPLRLILALLLLSGGYALGQSGAERLYRTADSLGNLLHERTPEYFKQSLAAAEAENNYTVRFQSLYRLGIYYDAIGEGVPALDCFRQATLVAAGAKKWMDVARGRNSMGVV